MIRAACLIRVSIVIAVCLWVVSPRAQALMPTQSLAGTLQNDVELQAEVARLERAGFAFDPDLKAWINRDTGAKLSGAKIVELFPQKLLRIARQGADQLEGVDEAALLEKIRSKVLAGEVAISIAEPRGGFAKILASAVRGGHPVEDAGVIRVDGNRFAGFQNALALASWDGGNAPLIYVRGGGGGGHSSGSHSVSGTRSAPAVRTVPSGGSNKVSPSGLRPVGQNGTTGISSRTQLGSSRLTAPVGVSSRPAPIGAAAAAHNPVVKTEVHGNNTIETRKDGSVATSTVSRSYWPGGTDVRKTNIVSAAGKKTNVTEESSRSWFGLGGETKKITRETGNIKSVTTIGPDKSRTTEIVQINNNKVSRTTISETPEGVRTVHHANGAVTVRDPNKGTIEVTSPKGVKTVTGPSGEKVVTHPDGRQITYKPTLDESGAPTGMVKTSVINGQPRTYDYKVYPHGSGYYYGYVPVYHTYDPWVYSWGSPYCSIVFGCYPLSNLLLTEMILHDIQHEREEHERAKLEAEYRARLDRQVKDAMDDYQAKRPPVLERTLQVERIFAVHESMDLESTEGDAMEICSLNQGDFVQLVSAPAEGAETAEVKVVGAGSESCAVGTKGAIPLGDLQEMENEFVQRLEDQMGVMESEKAAGHIVPREGFTLPEEKH